MFKKIIIIIIAIVVIVGGGLWLLTQKESEESGSAPPVQGGLTPEECATVDGRVLDTAGALICDENEISIGEIGGGFAYPRLCCVPFPESKKLTIEQAMEIAQNSECAEKGSLTDNYTYNPNSKTWWIDLEMKQEFEKEFCHPACVVKEYTKTAEINWRCMGALPPEKDDVSELLENLE